MTIRGFDTNYFVEKLFAYAETNFPTWAAGKTADDLEAALPTWYPDADGLDGAAEQMYTDFGAQWGLAPNEYFVPAEYKASWVMKYTQSHLATEAQASAMFDAAVAPKGEDYEGDDPDYNGDYYAHYLAEGALLGANPSNAFDESDYFQALIDGLDAVDEDGEPLTVDALRQAAFDADLTALDFFIDYPEFQDEYPAIPVAGDEVVLGASTGTAFTLTNQTDVATANIFTAGLVYTPGGDDRINALQDEDTLTGTGTNPTLNAELGNANDNGARVITPDLSNIETINVAFTGSGNAVTTLDLQDTTALDNINITRISQAIDMAEVANMTTAVSKMSIANSNANNLNGVAEFSFTPGTLAGENSADLTISNVNVVNLNVGQNTSGVGTLAANFGVGIQGYENLNIVSTGSANSIGVFNLPMDTNTTGNITITGDKDITVAANARVLSAAASTNVEVQAFGGGIAQAQGRLATVDASALEGSLVLAVGAGFAGVGGSNILSTGKSGTSGQVQNVTVTGTKNDDTFYLQDVVQAGDSLVGGDGTDKAVIYANGNAGKMSSIETIDVQINGNSVDIINFDFDTATDATSAHVRNITYGSITANVSGDDATNQQVNLRNLTAAQAGALNISHSTTANNAIADTTLNATLKTDSAADTMVVSINEGVNLDPRFNFTLDNLAADNVTRQTIETLTFKDADTESNTVALTNVGRYTGTINVGTTDGVGVAGTFINFDSGFSRAAAGVNLNAAGQQAAAFDQRGSYRLDVDGMANDYSITNAAGANGAIAAANVDAVVRDTASLTANVRYNTLDNGAAADVRITAQTFDASNETSDVIARFGDVTRTNGVSSMSVKGGAGNDTFIFDAQGVKNSGYTSGDTVAGGTGLDTLVIDGSTTANKADGTAGVGGNISVQKSEWDNTTGIDALRLAGNGLAGAQAVANVGNGAILGSNANLGGYYIEIDNDFVKQTDAANNLKIISNDGDLATNMESDLILNMRPLAQTSNVTFVGANSNGIAGVASNRLQLEDNSANGANAINGGDTNIGQTSYAATTQSNILTTLAGGVATNFGSTTNADLSWQVATGRITAAAAFATAGNTLTLAQYNALVNTDGNNNVLEVFNTADVSINDLAQTRNFGRIEATNDVATAQSLRLVLNDTVVEQMVDASHTASTSQTERLVVSANNNANVAAAVMNLNIDATAVTNKFGIDVYLDRNTNNTLSLSAGQDHVVMLGNYTAAQAAAYAEAGPGFNGANAITNPMLVAEATGVDYTGADAIAGTADDVLLAYQGRLIANGGADILEIFGGVDITAIPAADLAGFTIVAHSSIRLTSAQMNNVTGIQFVGAGVAHGLVVTNNAGTGSAGIADTAPSLAKVTVDGAASTFTYSVGATVPAATGTATTSNGAVAPTNAGTYTPTTTATTGTSSTTITAGIDTFNNSAVGTLGASFAGITYTAPTLNSDATLYTNFANLNNLDALTFGTGTDTLVFNDAVTNLDLNATTVGAAAGAGAVTGLNRVNLANVAANTVTVRALSTGSTSMVITGGTGQDIVTVATDALAVNYTLAGGADVLDFGTKTATNASINGGDGNDTFKFDQGVNVGQAATIVGGNGTDTVELTNINALIVDANFTNLNGVEVVKGSGTTTNTVTLGSVAKTAGINAVTFAAGTNTVNVGAAYGALALTGGTGVDTYVFADGASVGTGMATISNFVSGTDKVTMGQTNSSFLGTFTTEALGLAAMTANNQSFFVSGNNQLYVVATKNTLAATDDIVKFTGVTALTTADLGVGGVYAQTAANTFTPSSTFTAFPDVLTISGGFTSTATVDLLAGANTIILQNTANLSTGTYNATGGTVSYTIDGTTAVTMKSAQAALIGSATGTNNVTLSDQATAGIIIPAAVETVTLGNFANTFALAGTAHTVTGGTLVDAITFNAALTSASVTGGTGVDTIALANGANTISVNDADSINITGNAGVDAITFTSALAAATVTGGAGADTVALANGPNTISISDTDGIAITGNAGVDAITFTTAVTATTVTGGAGADTVALANAANTISINDTDGIAITGNATTDAITLTSGIATVTGAGGVDTLAASAGTLTITDLGVGGLVDIVTNAAGATVIGTATGAWTASAATINNAANTAFTVNVASAGAVDLTAAGTVNGYRVVSTGTSAVTGSAQADILTNTSGSATFTGLAGIDTFTATADTMTINDLGVGGLADIVVIGATGTVAAAVTGNWTATAASTNAGTAGLTGDFNISTALAGGANGWSITGGAASNTLIGSAQNDTIIGAAGQDVLTGGLGNDRFTYASATTSVHTATSAGATVWVNATTAATAAMTAGLTYTGAEVINDLITGDTIVTGNANLIVDAGTANMLEDNEFVIVQGTYVPATGVFTIGAGLNTGNDSMMIFDADSAGTMAWQTVIMVGVTAAEEGNIVNTAGVLSVFGA